MDWSPGCVTRECDVALNRYRNLHRLISEVSSKVDNLKTRNEVLRSEVENASELAGPPAIQTESPASTFLTVAEELHNRERRKNNVIVHNLPEKSSSDGFQTFAKCV